MIFSLIWSRVRIVFGNVKKKDLQKRWVSYNQKYIEEYQYKMFDAWKLLSIPVRYLRRITVRFVISPAKYVKTIISKFILSDWRQSSDTRWR